MEIKTNHIYTIKDRYFEEFPDPYLKRNKQQNRPHYYCFNGGNSQILWLIPLSTRIKKFERLIHKRASESKDCDVVHICKIGTRKQALLIQDMLPVTKGYIDKEYIRFDTHYNVI